MNNDRMTCDPKRIELFLSQQLSDEEQAAFELHLDDCNDCRRRLEATAAGDEIWSGVRDSLRGQQLPPDWLRSGDSALEFGRGRRRVVQPRHGPQAVERRRTTIGCSAAWGHMKSWESSDRVEWASCSKRLMPRSIGTLRSRCWRRISAAAERHGSVFRVKPKRPPRWFMTT